MTDDTAQILDDLLIRWHHACQHYRQTKGYASRSAGMGQYRSSRQYDDTNGALDEHLESARVKAVDFEVSEMHDPHKSAIHANARALVSGSRVWSSPRLPTDAKERGELITAARMLLVARLHSAGVM